MIETIGNRRIVKELGRGGMGVVYLAEHLHLEKMFAIKSLSEAYTNDPKFRQWFFQEANRQGILEHPNIVQVTDFHEEHGQYFLVMEYVDGEDLSNLIRQRGRLSEKEALPIIKDVLAGLGFAHRKGIIHLDIKPGNIMVGKDGRARVMDFGLAVLASEKDLTTNQSAGGISPWYASPEQIERHIHNKEDQPKTIDHRSDVYSLGIVLFEMLTGEVPFDGETNIVIHQQVNEAIPDPSKINPHVSKELSHIIQKCVAKDPDKRFQGCDQLLNVLVKYEKRKTRRRNIFIGSSAIIFTCVFSFLTYGLMHKGDMKAKNEEIKKAEYEALSANLDRGANLVVNICDTHSELSVRKRNIEELEYVFIDDKESYNKMINQVRAFENNIKSNTYELNRILGILKVVSVDDMDEIINDKKSYQYNPNKAYIFEKIKYLTKNNTNQLSIEEAREYFCSK